MFDIISVGHLAIDSILLPNRNTPFVVLGGPPTYVSLAARRLDSRVAVVSKIGSDFPTAYSWWLGQEGIDLSGVTRTEEARTTRFYLRYNGDLTDRVLQLRSKAPPITVADLPNPLKARAIHIAPIAGEIQYEVAEKLRGCADILSLDPQGLVRGFDEKGDVRIDHLTDKRILGIVDVFKSSRTEIEAVTGESDLNSAVERVHGYGPKIVIVTLGAAGAAVSVENMIHTVPAYESGKVVDPTGAGDAFIGGFLAEYVRGEDCSWCSCVGAAMASLVVEGIGPTHFGEKEEIYRRARSLYEKEIK